MSGLFESLEFEPTTAAARARLAAVRPAAYARTRNAIDGDVTRLSPYLTHGLLTLPQALAGVLQRGPLPVQHKLVYEFGWREYFHHVWAHEGDGIFDSLHAGVLPDDAYARELPPDIRAGATGLPVIDQAVRTLYRTGYLHNHARMWLASYVVHLRKVHWRAGADWLYGHLLDGDLASNHLSWQWVAGTGSHKPYLFNAENVERHAPAAWHSRGTVIDTDYDTLDLLARNPKGLPGGQGDAVAEPALLGQPPAGLCKPLKPAALRGRAVLLVHPWSLAAEMAPGLAEGAARIGMLDSEFHRRWPWSPARWQFVATRLSQVCEFVGCGNADEWHAALRGAAELQGRHSAHLSPAFASLDLQAETRMLQWPAQRCHSFSQFWARATKGVAQARELTGG
ncbi:MAG: FAD-binding domain-containing protein [Rubrivivax sp.]|nr:FAD-binding domain-containing protein [Rubrivivax sp.]